MTRWCKGCCGGVCQGDLARALAGYEQYLELSGGIRDGDQKEVEQRIRSLRAQLGD